MSYKILGKNSKEPDNIISKIQSLKAEKKKYVRISTHVFKNK